VGITLLWGEQVKGRSWVGRKVRKRISHWCVGNEKGSGMDMASVLLINGEEPRSLGSH